MLAQVYCLPDMYEVVDRSLDVIRFVLNPRFGRDEIAAMDTRLTWERALDGSEYMPGLVGLNNMKVGFPRDCNNRGRAERQ